MAMLGLAREPVTAAVSARPPTVLAPPRLFRRSPLPSWKIASFSSLAHHRQGEGEIHDDLPENDTPQPESFLENESEAASAAIGSIAEFEAGARAGLLFHDIMEHIDFDLAQRANWKPIVEDRLLAHGYALGWTNPVLDMLGRVLTAPLNDGRTAPFSLGQVAPGDRLNELEFHLPLHAFDAADLRHVLAECGPPLLQESVAPLIERLTFSLNGGYLKGYIDLVFRHGNRFYLVDWKSNHLGDRVAAYHPDRLAGVMAAEYYFLQYHLYALAVDRFLTSSCPGYSFDRDFGGVFYCFIRGMGPSAGPPAGVFFDRPSQKTMKRLQNLIK
jgi:exodeoxyribonuclease V beta subunit